MICCLCSISTANWYNFGVAAVGGNSGAITFTIENTGTAALTLSGTPKIVISGVNSADFSVNETSTTSSIAVSGNTTFTVTFAPSSAVAKNASLIIANDDSDEGSYTIMLNGTGTSIPTPGYDSSPASGGTINIGNVPVGSPATTTLQVSETGTALLDVTGYTITGANPGDFWITPDSLSIADGGAAQNFTIQCTPSATGPRTATLTVKHNASGSPAIYTLNCTGTSRVDPLPYPVIFVNAAATGSNNGTSWTNACRDLQTALNIATSGSEIWVAAGIYKPTPGTDRTISFEMRGRVGIYGGFAGTESAFEQRDWETNKTILSGDIGNSGDTDNSYHVVTSSGLDNTAVLEGFTITGGNTNESGKIYSGGGMYNYNSSSPTVTNCTFSDNSTDHFGGGMYNINSSSPTITNCSFSGNISKSFGGGIYNTDSSSLTITNCIFSGNTAKYGGGGMYNTDSSSTTVTNCSFFGNTTERGVGIYNKNGDLIVTNCSFFENTGERGGGILNSNSSLMLTNCSFFGNSVSYGGSGVYNSESSSATVTNCSFFGNTTERGGGILNSNSSLMIANCTFSGNTAEYYGGGILNSSSSLTVTNCILWNNLPNEINDDNSSPTVSYSIIKGGFTGTGNLDVNPLFVSALAPSSAPTTAGDYRLQGTSPAINAGNSAAVPAGITTDLDDNPRISGTTVDIGAYEFLPAPEISLKQGTTDIASGGFHDFGSVAVGGDSGAIEFIIENTDTAVLVLTGTPKIAISGTDAADFAVDETSTTASVAGSGNTTFTVTFTPSSAGAKAATISIANNDSDENPYTVTLNGTGIATPGYASTPVSGSTIDVGTAEIGSSASASLQINETGTAALNITGCTISGANSADFSVSPSSLTIADGGAAQNITIQCTPSAAGTRTATLTVAHNASGSPATYTLNATGTATPGYASSPVSGSTITLMPTEVGVSTSVILQINETGTAALNITNCTISGANAADFSVSPSTFSIADGGAAQNIIIQCAPSATGTRTATLTVTHNAPDSPATYTLNCTATESTITPAVTTTEVSGITATEAVSGGNVAYPENCTATLLASGLVWNTVTPAYPADAHTSAGTEPGSFTGALTGLLPQTTYYVRAYVQYKLNGVVQILYGDTYELTTSALPGDVNGDKVLDLKDAILALKIVTGAAGNAAINLPADVNGDGKIGMEEAVYVLQNVGIEG